MNRINYFYLFISVILLGACTDEYSQKTANGFLYKIHKKGNGEKVNYDSYVYTWFSISTGDSILFETEKKEGKRVLLRTPDSQRATIKDPVLDILPLLSVGDSATVITIVDEIMRLSDDLKDVEQLYYHVVVKRVETLEARKEAEQLERNRRTQSKKRNLQRSSERMQKHPEGGMAYQRLRTAITTYSNHPDLIKTTSGLEYIIFEEGEKPLCQTDEQVSVNYIGMQEDALVFDETYSSEQPFKFVLNKGRVVKAWDEGIQLLGINGAAFFKVPPALGYGATGYEPLIKPNATLYFYVKVVSKK